MKKRYYRSDPSIRWDAADQLQTDKLKKNSSGAAAARQRMLDRRNKGIVKNEP